MSLLSDRIVDTLRHIVISRQMLTRPRTGIA